MGLVATIASTKAESYLPWTLVEVVGGVDEPWIFSGMSLARRTVPFLPAHPTHMLGAYYYG